MCVHPQGPEGGIRFFGVTGSCELPDTGVGSQTQVLWRARSALNPQIIFLVPE